MYKYEFERNKLKSFLGKELYNLLKKYNCYIGGGMISSIFTKRDINDIDVYFKSKEDIKSFIIDEVGDYGFTIYCKTKKALTCKTSKTENDPVVQLVCFDAFEKAEDIFDTFDFTACMGVYDFATEEFVLHDDFLKHNSQRILMFNENTSYPIVSLLRVDKYKTKGYTISKEEYLRIILTCMDLHINNYNDLKEQLGGMYGVDYDKILKPKDGEEFNLRKMIKKMREIIYDENYFENQTIEQIYIEDFEILASEMTNEPIELYSNGKRFFKYDKECDSFMLIKSLTNYDNIIKKNLSDYFGNDYFYIYKRVQVLYNGELVSSYDNNFKYKLNETIVPNNIGEQCYGIYGSMELTNLMKMYSESRILKLKCNVDDIIEIERNKTLRMDKVIPVAVYTEEEFKNIIKEYEKNKKEKEENTETKSGLKNCKILSDSLDEDWD